MISVTVATPDLDISEQWDDLAGRAANVFMNPVALRAASDTLLAVITVLLAWDVGVEPARLVGVWALQAKQLLPLWPAFLDAFPYEYAFLSAPMVDPARAKEVMPAFLAAIARDQRLPKVVWMQDMDAEGAVFEALQQSLGEAGLPQLRVRSGLMPIVTREFGVKSSGSTRKKLRQDWNRLGALGAVTVVNGREAEAADAAMEVFLGLEAASWKGKEKTALLSNPVHAAFARRLVHDLAARGEASVAVLSVAGRPIAAQVLLYCGSVAYTWKTAFDAEFARYSPGALLVDRLTEQLLAGGEIATIDSCALEGSFMGQIWSGRKPVANLLIGAVPGRSPAFLLQALYRRSHESLRQLRNRWREGRLVRGRPGANAGKAAGP